MTAQMTFEYEFATPALDEETAERRIALDFYERASALDEDQATFSEAAALYQRAIDTDPQFAIAYTNLGNIHFRQGNEQRAVELYEQALSIDESQPEAHHNLGYVKLERGLAPSAVSHFERAIENDPHFDTAHFNLAMALERAGNPARAQRHWQQYLEIEPTGTLANVARLHQFVWADSGRLASPPLTRLNSRCSRDSTRSRRSSARWRARRAPRDLPLSDAHGGVARVRGGLRISS